MPKCLRCEKPFPNRIIVDNKERNLQRRKYCFECSPFGTHNTRKLTESYEKLTSLEPGKRRYLLPCPRCKKEKVLKSRKSLCYGCAITKRRRMLKLKAIEYKGGKCQACGYDKSARALCFHHLNPEEKDFSITSTTRTWEIMKKELDKCVLLCQNCHEEEHEHLEKEKYKFNI